MNVIGYPQPSKAKSLDIVSAFCAGAGGRVVYSMHFRHLLPGPAAAFYGTAELEHLVLEARGRAERDAGDFYYIDNAYFDRARELYFRVSLNGLQVPRGRGDRHSYARLERLGIRVKPWRSGGKHVLVVEQSDYFMRELASYERGQPWLPGGLEAWRWHVVKSIEAVTDRPIVVRRWLRDKTKASSSLADDLAGAWAVVTHSSAAAVEALLAGIPVFATGQTAAGVYANRDLAQIEAPVMADDCREEWAAGLAASQWTMEEMRSGIAWRALQNQKQELYA